MLPLLDDLWLKIGITLVQEKVLMHITHPKMGRHLCQKFASLTAKRLQLGLPKAMKYLSKASFPQELSWCF